MPVTLTLGDRAVTVLSDRGGYLDHRVTRHSFEPGWHTTAQTAQSRPAECPVLIVDDAAEFGLVSDIDDTILTTWLPRPMVAAWNSFVRDRSNRQSIPGMAASTIAARSPPGRAAGVPVDRGVEHLRLFSTASSSSTATQGPAAAHRLGAHQHRLVPLGHGAQAHEPAAAGGRLSRGALAAGGRRRAARPGSARQFASHPNHVAAVAIRQLSPTGERVLAHGTNMPLDEREPPVGADDTWVGRPTAGPGRAAEPAARRVIAAPSAACQAVRPVR